MHYDHRAGEPIPAYTGPSQPFCQAKGIQWHVLLTVRRIVYHCILA